jgi:DNA-binding HxlR family transcriptional regulator
VTSILLPFSKTDSNRNLFGTLKSLDAMCKNCNPTSPLECISKCPAYKLKNELRTLREALSNPDYMKNLLNSLKNNTRLNILQLIVNGRYSVTKLNKELKKTGPAINQDILREEYLHSLIAVGLANEAREEYYATLFGGRLSEMLGCFSEFAEKLPAHSECYEETILLHLLSGPKTFEEIESVVPPKIISRTLKRLRLSGLITTPEERDYIFFFRSKRDPTIEILAVTEHKIYEAIANDGSPAGKLAKDTGLSQVIIYKYLRHLRGKKLVFTRRMPKVYSLTCDGEKLAVILQKLQQVVEDAGNSSEQVLHGVSMLNVR